MKNRIEELRKKQGMTQKGLAEKAGLCRSTIVAMERGTHGSHMYSKLQVCKALEKTYEEIFEEAKK